MLDAVPGEAPVLVSSCCDVRLSEINVLAGYTSMVLNVQTRLINVNAFNLFKFAT